MKFHQTLQIALAVTLIYAANADAAPLLAGYPPPGGVTFSSNGVNSASGLRMQSYSNLQTANWTKLYWGANDAITASLDGSPDTLVFDSVIGNIATWKGTTM